MKMQVNPKASRATLTVYEVSYIFLIDMLTCGVQSTRIAMVDNAPLFRVFDEECNITQRLSFDFLYLFYILLNSILCTIFNSAFAIAGFLTIFVVK